MIIKNAYDGCGDFIVLLVDDGTLDTVISVSHLLIAVREYRYDCEYAAQHRDNNGTMTNDGFVELAEESVDAFIEDHLQ